MRKTSGRFDRTAVSPYQDFCDGYGRPGSRGIGYVCVVKVATGTVEKTDDFLVDGIVAYDRAEANDAYIGQINMETASSFCGIAGNVWGYDLARNAAVDTEPPLFEIAQYDGSMLPVYDAAPLIDAGVALFGRQDARRFPPAPGAHVICANKSTTNLRPATGSLDPAQGEAYGVWCYIALSISRDRDNSADLFIEDSGTWTKNDDASELKAFLDRHRKSVAWSIVACGKDQSVLYDRTFISYASVIMQPGTIGTALTVAPYITLAKGAVPTAGFDALYLMSLTEWDSAVGT